MEAELPDFVGGEDGGPYQAAAVVLATVIGPPADDRGVLAARRDANPGEDIVSFPRSHGGHRLADLIETIRKDIPVPGELATYQE